VTPDIDDLAGLEGALLTAPFDNDLRQRYATALLAAARGADAFAQAELLARQQAGLAAPAVLAARALLLQGRSEEALSRYLAAQALAGFEPDRALDELAAQAQPAAPASSVHRLQLVSTPSGSAQIRSIQQVEAEKVRFSSVVGMDELKKTLRVKIIEPYLRPGLFQRFRMGGGGGILLYGPPGCGKTMLARALANECNAGFISVAVSDVLAMWLGESERNLAAMFDKARQQTPCVLFFDELDALAYARSKAGSSSARTVVNEFLSQLDGMGRDNQGVLVLAATNMPWDVDDAMKRPGRFARQIFVPPPDEAARRQMLHSKLLGVPAQDLDYARLAGLTAQFSGADIDGLIDLAKESALADSLEGEERGVTMADFEHALSNHQASTLEWLRTVRNVVKYAGGDGSYKDVERYLKSTRML
jgi:transitional endoplasmic reticulum ATPase